MVHISVKMVVVVVGGGGGGVFDHFSSFTECHYYIIEDFMLLLGGFLMDLTELTQIKFWNVNKYTFLQKKQH